MKILITGSSGMLGKALCEVLSAENDVVGVDLVASTDNRLAEGSFIKLDLTNREEVRDVFSREDPDVVIHGAAWADVDGCELDPDKARLMNVQVTSFVAEACSKCEADLLSISTDFVFDGKKDSPYEAADSTNPISVYGRTKREAELELQKLTDKWTIVRTSWLYGDGGKNFVEAILNKAKSGEEIRVVDDQVGSPTYTYDLACAVQSILRLVPDKRHGIYQVSNSGACSWFGFAEEILKIADIEDVEIGTISSKELDRPALRPAYSVMSSERFKSDTGEEMRPWKDALKEYMRKRA